MLPTYGRTHNAHPLLKTFYLPHMQCGQIIFDVKPLARPPCAVWQYGLWSFQTGDTKLERFLTKNQHILKGNY